MTSLDVWNEIRNKWEGGISNRSNAADPGGYTVKGITLKQFQANDWGKVIGKPSTKATLDKLTTDDVNQIALHIWNASKVSDIKDPGFQVAVADTIWNGGGYHAFGVSGPGGVNDLASKITLKQFMDRKLSYLQSLKNYSANKKGWLNRMNDILSHYSQPLYDLSTPDKMVVVVVIFAIIGMYFLLSK